MSKVTEFIESMKYIVHGGDDPTLEYIMELAKAIESDMESAIKLIGGSDGK